MFIIWGGLHGAGLVIHKLSKPLLDKIPDIKPVLFLSWLLTFSFVIFLWIFFRSASMEACVNLITHIAFDFDYAYAIPFFQTRTTYCVFLAIIFLFHFLMQPAWYDKIKALFIRSSWVVKAFIFLLVIQLVLHFSTGDIQPFIYFQF
jgi:phosphatidylglycerophosphate synthase